MPALLTRMSMRPPFGLARATRSVQADVGQAGAQDGRAAGGQDGITGVVRVGDVDADDIGPGLRQRHGHALAQAGVAAGDDGHAAFGD